MPLPAANYSPSTDWGVDARQTKDVVIRIARSTVFREYQRAFETLTGLPLTIRAVGSFEPPMRGSKNANPFCTSMAGTNKTCAACLDLQEQLEAASVLRAETMACFAGLVESAIPIRVNGIVVGYLRTGQVFLRHPSPLRFKKIRKRFEASRDGFDWLQLKRNYLASRALTPWKYQAILRLLTIFAEYLSAIGDQLLLIQKSSDSPVITKTCAYINEHKADAISLAEVARTVNTSVFYFSKQFKKGTGLTFTEYVSRARVESVKTLLLNLQKPICEAAFEAGFQSLSQFNRVFHRATGESPSDFRQGVHAPPRAEKAVASLAKTT
jgi:AraC-like DNA-binding protein